MNQSQIVIKVKQGKYLVDRLEQELVKAKAELKKYEDML